MIEAKSAALLSNGLPQPPIPHRLRELLRDYPDHLERMQEALNYAFDGPRPARGSANHVFEQVIWALEGRLETFVREAKAELRSAEASDDADVVARATENLRLMFRARSSNGGMQGLHDLWGYIETHRDALR